MSDALVSLLAGSPALTLLVKVTVVLGGGFLGAWLARRRSAATRHLVWLIAVSGSLAVAPLTLVAPRLVVGLPAPWASVRPRASAPAPAVASIAGPAASRPLVARQEGWPGAPPAPHRDAAPRRTATFARRWPPNLMWALIWLTGAMLVLLWSGLGHLAVRGLGRSARALGPEGWRSLVPPGSVAGHVAGRVTFGTSPALGTPLTWGWRHPVILLPEASAAWPDHRRRAALLHELAHVARRDYLAQMATTLACAVYWFHPLVWWGARRLRRESEHACDDLVLAAGTPAHDYAADLLEVARGARALHAVGLAAIGMARRSQLEGRLLAVLDETRPRRAFSRRAAAAAVATAALGLIPLAGLQPGLAAAGASPRDRVALARAAAEADADRGSNSNDRGTGSPRDEDSNAGRSSAPGGGSKDRVGTSTVNAAAGERLELNLDTGGDVEIRGWDRPSVEVRFQLGGRDWRDTRVVAERINGGVRVRSFLVGHPRSSSTSHRFELRVPRRFDLELRSAGGAVSLTDLEGTFEGHTGGGEITIEHAKGRAELATGGGDIHVTDSDLGGRVSTGGGTVRLSSVRGGLRGASGGGPVIYSDGTRDESAGDLGGVKVSPDGSHIGGARDRDPGFLHISRAGGEVNLDDAPGGAEITTGGGDIHVRHGAGDIRARTGGGEIEVGPVAGSVWASTGGGDIRITLEDADGKKQTIDASSGGGKVILELPSGLDARFDLETAYTRHSGGETRITSAWSLDRDPVTDWDAHEGSPRRYVRAHGVAGNGRGLIRVRTVNGDIEVRKAAR
jgi:beta-lactamase regulating signal transducer with metallopeptidase domain/DUF4097 and DUF4098 domain-containing protein YvlB